MLIGCAGNAFAADHLLEEMDTCAKIKNHSQRLDCYDALQKKYGKTPPRGVWRLETKIFPEESKQINLSLQANNAIVNNAKTNTPTLVLRCKQNKTEVYIVTGIKSYINQAPHRSTVYLSFDDEKPQQFLFTESIDGQALFAPNPLSLIRTMLKSKTLTVQFTPSNAYPAMITFNINGLDKLIEDLRKECHEK